MKQAILKRYNINEETYPQRVRNTKKKTGESYAETEVWLKDLSAKSLMPTERTKKDLVNINHPRTTAERYAERVAATRERTKAKGLRRCHDIGR